MSFEEEFPSLKECTLTDLKEGKIDKVFLGYVQGSDKWIFKKAIK